ISTSKDTHSKSGNKTTALKEIKCYSSNFCLVINVAKERRQKSKMLEDIG
ncbi:5738_t:CDS:2, partial [Racocetra persica]